MHNIRTSAAIATAAAAFAVASGAAAQDDRTILKIWDQWEYYGMSAAGPAVDVIHRAYEEENPNVVMSRSVFGGGWPIRNAVELALTSGDAPDVFYSWPSGAGLTAYAREGYLLDLTPYADQYNWWDRLPEWAIERNMFQGKLYAYPWEQDLEYVYYNTRIFAELGLTPPTSFDEVLNWCNVATEAGYVPISFSNSPDGWQGANMFTDMVALTGGRQLGLDVLQGRKPWNSPELVEALELLLQMVDADCFTPGFNGIHYGDSLAQFYTGQATSVWTGTWVIHEVVASVPEDELDVFYMPQIKPDVPQATHMSEGSAYYVWGGTNNADLAAAYIEFMTNPRWLSTWIEDGFAIPIQKTAIDWEAYDVQPVIAKAFDIGQAMQENNVDAFHTTVAPNVVRQLYQGLQGVFGGDMSVEAFLDAMDAESAIAAEKGQVWEPGDRS